ncbi:MAG: TIR domain-containing protein, partial [Desulfobacteraceae bacterium]|nr:TIR domain-containing protein [Desulfobacteraceae bacterium]
QLYEDITKAGISVWWDEESLLAGQEREFEIRKAIKNCSYFITLLSRHSVSEQGIIQKEQKYAINCADERPHGDIFIIPAKIEPCESSYETHHKLVWVNLFPEYKSGIRKILEVLKPEKEIPLEILNPYRGLEAFREQDSPYYFGRDAVIRNLQNTVQKQPFVAVIGASGSGKSSLVFAGLTPCLKNPSESSSGKEWIIASFRPKNQPFNNLALALIPLLYKDKLEQAEQLTKFTEKLDKGNIGLSQVVQLIIQEHVGKRFLLIADQFEELYTLNPDKDLQRRFVDALLKGLSANDFTLLLTMRADFMGQAIAYTPFAEALNVYKPVILPPMKETELRLAIEKPAGKLGVRLEPGLADLILKDLGNEPGNLPLLEFALTQLWEQQTFRQLTHEAYKNIGGVNQALARYADSVYAEFTEEEQKQIRQIFVQLVNPGQGTEDTRQVATFEQVKEENRNLITKLADKRLIVTGRNEETKQKTVEVVHEALIRYWQPLKNWVGEDREFRVWQERLRSTIKQWNEKNQDEGALLRGASLTEAEEKLNQYAEKINPVEIAYVEVSIALREKEIKEKERARREREKLRLGVNWVFGVSLVVALIFSGEIWLKSRESNRNLQQAKINEIEANRNLQQAKINEVEALSQSSYVLLLSGGNDLEALIASVKAGKRAKQVNLSAELKHQMLSNFREVIYGVREINRLKGFAGSVAFSPDGKKFASGKLWDIAEGRQLAVLTGHSVVFDPDGKVLVLEKSDKTIKLFDIEEKKQIAQLTGRTYRFLNFAFSLDGKMLAVGYYSIFAENSTIMLWDTQRKKEIAEIKGHTSQVENIAFSPDGKMLAFESDRTIRIWNIAERKQIAELKEHTSSFLTSSSIAFSPDGKMIASGSDDKTIKLWSIAEKKQITVLTGHTDSVNTVAFSPDGKILASGSDDNTIKLWDIAGKKQITELTGHADDVKNVAFSPDGKMLASGSDDNTIKLWDIAGKKQITELTGHTDDVKNVAFSPGGQMLASRGDDRTIKLWSIIEKKQIAQLARHSVNTFAFSPNRKLLASEDNDNTIILWDIAAKKQIAQLTGHTSIAFSSDGKIFVSTTHDNAIRLWDIAENKQIAELKGHTSPILSVAFSPDGKIFASGSSDRSVIIWGITEKKQITELLHDGLKAPGTDDVKIPWTYDLIVAFSPDGKMLASGSGGRSVKLWDIAEKKQITELTGHADSVNTFAFSPDGKMLASGCEDNTIKLWDIAEKKQIAELTGHTDEVNSVAFSPDEKMLASGSNDNTIKLWNMEYYNSDLDGLLKHACNQLSPYLKHNPDVSEEDKTLCDDILSEPQIHTD